jgi:hypothetical protein
MEKETKQRYSAGKIVLAVVAVTALAAMCIFAVKDAQQRKAAAYQEELKQVAERIQGYAEDAYDMAAVQASVWRNSIYQERDASTDPYTMEDGVFLEDFNDALGKLYGDSDFQSKGAFIDSNRKSVAEGMSRLKDAPEGYEDAYQALKAYYDAYIRLTNLALNSAGYTYSDFNSELGDLNRELDTCYLTIATYVG